MIKTDSNNLRSLSPPSVLFPAAGLMNRFRCLVWAAAVLAGFPISWSAAQENNDIRCVIIEVYLSDKDELSSQALKAARELAKSNKGIRLAIRKIDDSESTRLRLQNIAKYYKLDPDLTPVLYCCNQVIHSAENSDEFRKRLEKALEIEVFKREGCPHCKSAERYLAKFTESYPGFKIVYRDILKDTGARTDLSQLVRKYRTAAASTPVFHYCDSLLVGFDRDETTGRKIEKALNRWTIKCTPRASKKPDDKTSMINNSSGNALSQVVAPEVAQRLPF